MTAQYLRIKRQGRWHDNEKQSLGLMPTPGIQSGPKGWLGNPHPLAGVTDVANITHVESALSPSKRTITRQSTERRMLETVLFH